MPSGVVEIFDRSWWGGEVKCSKSLILMRFQIWHERCLSVEQIARCQAGLILNIRPKGINMKALKKTLAAVAATALLSIGTSAQAGVIIDLFTDNPSQSVSSSVIDSYTNDSRSGLGGVAIGAYRDLSVVKTAPDFLGTADEGAVTLAAGGGNLTFSTAAGVFGRGVVTWDGATDAGNGGSLVNPLGLGGIDLTLNGAANALFTDIAFADLGFKYQIKVWDIFGQSSTLSAEVQFPVPLGADTSADYFFDWFNKGDGNYNESGLKFNIVRGGNPLLDVDFKKIGALQLHLYSEYDPLLTLQEQKTSIDMGIGAITTVPEPGTLALVGAALFGVAAAGRRRKA